MRIVTTILLSPAFVLGWVVGLTFRYFVNGWFRGLYHFELKEETRKQSIIEEYSVNAMNKEVNVFEQLIPGIKIHDPNDDT